MTPACPSPHSDADTLDGAAVIGSRLNALELKASDADDSIEQLNLALYRQQQQIDRLLAQVAQLRMQVPEAGASPVGNTRDELPPHY